MDVHFGYNNLLIADGDQWKAAFLTNRGLFEPMVMFFGLTNSSATFQTMMDDIFQDLIATGKVVIYMDNILVGTETLEEHRTIVTEILKCLQDHNLFLKPEKCTFETKEVEYLGMILGHGKISMTPSNWTESLTGQPQGTLWMSEPFWALAISIDDSYMTL